MEALGRHVLLELRSCNPQKLDDLPFLRETMLHAAEETGATVIGEIFHHFSPQGVTGVVAIAESHLCVHTWPEHRYAAVDIFTCGDAFDPAEAGRLIIDQLEAEDTAVTVIPRGQLGLVPDPVGPA